MSTITIAGVDLEATLGADVHDLGASLDGAIGSQAGIEVPTLPGVLRAGPFRTPIRTFTTRLTLDGASQSAVRANLDTLKALCGSEEDSETAVTIVLGDQTGRQIDARCVKFATQRYPLQGTANSLNEIPVLVEIDWQADLPYWQDVTPQSVDFTTSDTDLPQGTAPSYPVLTTDTAAAAADTLTCKDRGGTTLWTCTLAARSSGERYRFTTARGVMTLEKYSGGSWAVSEGSRTAGVFPLPIPASSAGYLASSWPTLASTTGAWNAAYPRSWR